MLHALKQLLPVQLQQQAVVIKRTFIERDEPESQAVCCSRPRYFSDSAVIGDIEVLSDICSTGEEWGDASADSETSDGESAGGFMGYEGDVSAGAESSDGEDTPSSRPRSSDSSWRHLRTMSTQESVHATESGAAPVTVPQATESGAAPVAVPRLSLSSLLPDCTSSHSEQAQGVAQRGTSGPQLYAVVVPVMPWPSGTVAAAPAAGEAAPSPPAPAPAAPACEATARSGGPQRPSEAAEQERRTTVMVRNLPNNYSRDNFLALLEWKGLAGLFDFVYLPVDFMTGAGLGYAFVNMVNSQAALRLRDSLAGFCRWEVPSRKRCSVVWNEPLQGLDAIVERYRNSPVMHPSVPDSYKPVIFSKGVRIPYPAPTKAMKAPRLRKGA